jgi:hypothetical protein
MYVNLSYLSIQVYKGPTKMYQLLHVVPLFCVKNDNEKIKIQVLTLFLASWQ